MLASGKAFPKLKYRGIKFYSHLIKGQNPLTEIIVHIFKERTSKISFCQISEQLNSGLYPKLSLRQKAQKLFEIKCACLIFFLNSSD